MTVRDGRRVVSDLGPAHADCAIPGGAIVTPMPRGRTREQERLRKAAWTEANREYRNAYLRAWRASRRTAA